MGGCILIVDDDADDMFALKTVLEPLGDRIATAFSGEDALRHLLQEEVAVILMDLMMPRLNGFETAALIRKREKSRDIPIIFLTGFERDETRFLPGYSPEFTEFIRKPVDAELLRSKIKDCLRRFHSAERR